jgi:energy-coupling factor transporter ATP-binding protein EcfA2
LLLDEPTNHLDLASISWLEEFLVAWPGTLVFVTHDRAFLDRIATRIVELDRGKLRPYPGNYAAYQIQKEEQLAQEAVIQAKADKLLAQEEIWIRKGVEARRTRSQSRITRLQNLRGERAARREKVGNVKMEVASGLPSGKLVAELTDVASTIAELLGEGCRIVETGTVRDLGNWEGDGQSTIVWDQLATDLGGTVTTIDINPLGAELVAELGLQATTAIVGDSLDVIPTLSGHCDFLYLDSFDVDFENPQPAAAHHLSELMAALNLLAPGSIVAVDDNQDDQGKGSEVAWFLAEHGANEIVRGYVRVWRI